MTRRAESQQATRLRITESAVALHGSLGPARTSMSAVAHHAGVTRSTLYRHFPDDAALFDACSAHWSLANPPPDIAAWAAIADPGARLATALAELYAFYARNAGMLENLMRDRDSMPVVDERFAGFDALLRAATDVLTHGRRLRGAARRPVRGAIGHALALSTWRSLVRDQDLDPPEAVRLMCGLVESAGTPPV